MITAAAWKSSPSGSSTAAQAGTATISAKPPGRLMPIMPVGLAAILGTNLERHDASGGNPHPCSPTRNACSERIDSAGPIDARDQRKDGSACALAARSQTHVEHAIDGGGVNADADLASARLGIRHGLIFKHVRRPKAAHDDCFHASPSFVTSSAH